MENNIETTEVRQAIEALINKYGTEAVTESSLKLANLSGLKLPVDNLGVLHPKVIENTIRQLDGCISDVIEAGDKRESAYQHIGELRGQIRELETEIELTESQAFMQLVYEGKSVSAMLDGVKVPLNNDAMRSAYKKTVTKDLRTEMANLEAQIAKIQTGIDKATQDWETATVASKMVARKADIQAKLLEYAGGTL